MAAGPFQVDGRRPPGTRASSPNKAAAVAASPTLKAAARRQRVMARRSPGKKSSGFGARLPLAVRAPAPSLSLGSSTRAEQPETRAALAQAVHLAERTSHSSMFSPMVLPVTVLQAGVERAHALEFAEDRVDAAGAVDVLDVVVGGRATPCTGKARGGRWRRCGRCRKGCRPRARWPACAGRCWSSRPWRRPARWRCRRPPASRCRAA